MLPNPAENNKKETSKIIEQSQEEIDQYLDKNFLGFKAQNFFEKKLLMGLLRPEQS